MQNIDFSLIIAQLINFLILFFLFKRYVATYLNSLIEKRNATVEKVQGFDAYYEKRVAELKEKEATLMDEAKKNVRGFIAQSELISQKKSAEIIEKANSDVKVILDWWRRQIEKERFEMIEASRKYILGLAFKINQKLLWTQWVSKEFIEEELKKMQ